MQRALDVLLAHVRALGGPAGVDGAAAQLLSRQIKALHGPLTDLLTRRLEILEPGLPAGEALFAATADARVICSVGVQLIRR